MSYLYYQNHKVRSIYIRNERGRLLLPFFIGITSPNLPITDGTKDEFRLRLPEARLCRNETALYFTRIPALQTLYPVASARKDRDIRRYTKKNMKNLRKRRERYLKGKRKPAPTLIISKSALDKNKLMPRESRTHTKYIIFAGQTIKEIWNN